MLDYLCNNCYANTARAFARDSTPRELDKDGDEVLLEEGTGYGLDSNSLRSVRIRKGVVKDYVSNFLSCAYPFPLKPKEIQARIMAGHIPECIEYLNNYFPDVLSSTSSGSLYDASHLHLNLKIQHFVEQARTVPLPWPHDMGTKFYNCQANAPANKEEEKERGRRLLSLMEELYSLVYALPGNNKDRDIYIAELNSVGGLLTYTIPEKDRELRKYLDKERREAVANQINEAILCMWSCHPICLASLTVFLLIDRMNKTVPSIIELISRQTTILFSTLHHLNYPLPAAEQRPTVLKNLLSKPARLTQDIKPPKGDKDKDKDKESEEVNIVLYLTVKKFIKLCHFQIVPIFELSTLLGAET